MLHSKTQPITKYLRGAQRQIFRKVLDCTQLLWIRYHQHSQIDRVELFEENTIISASTWTPCSGVCKKTLEYKASASYIISWSQ